jgi:hypothetical protein
MEIKDRFFAIYRRTYIPEDLDRWSRFFLANHDGRMLLICLGGLLSVPLPTLAILAALGLLQAVYRVKRIRRIDRSTYG